MLENMSENMPKNMSDAVAQPVLAMRDVDFGYQAGRPIVEQFSAALGGGRLLALIGPNAAGKSTLLKLMLGLLEPWAGQVELLGRQVGQISQRRRAAQISYVPQRGSLGFTFTVRQVVEMGRFASASDPDAVSAALESCDLGDIEHRIFAHLSGGQQQRVMIARALAQSCGAGRVMLLDEPASAMDLWHIRQTMNLLTQQAQAGLAVVVVVHDLNLAARYADDVWLIDSGRLVAAGTWNQVMQPQVLEPVYRVPLTSLSVAGVDRPVLLTQ